MAVGAPPAAAGPVTIGQMPPGTPSPICSNGPNDQLQSAVASGTTYTAPVSGVITSWSTNAAAGSGQMLKFKVFRNLSGSTYEAVGHDARSLTGGMVNTFAVSIPAQAGDIIGTNDENAIAVNNACDFAGTTSDDNAPYLPQDLNDGESGAFTDLLGIRVNVSAVLVPTPGITSVSPSSGPATGGTTVTISGHDFDGTTAVDFGSVPAQSFTINSDSLLTAVSPADSPGTVDITVSNPGQSPTGAADKFTFNAVTNAVCVVPKLKHKKLKRARKALRRADCRLGRVKGPRSGRVKKQRPKPGTVRPAGSKVKVRLG